MAETEGKPLSEILFGMSLHQAPLAENALADALSLWLAEARRRAAGQHLLHRVQRTKAPTGRQQATSFPPM